MRRNAPQSAINISSCNKMATSCGPLGAASGSPGRTPTTVSSTRDQLYKIGLPGKSILGYYFQENRTSQRPFLLLRISFPGRPIFIQFVPGTNCIKWVFPENRFSETIFKRIGLPGDLFSYWESVFPEDLFLYNCPQNLIDFEKDGRIVIKKLQETFKVQGDTSGCSLGSVDVKPKVPFSIQSGAGCLSVARFWG